MDWNRCPISSESAISWDTAQEIVRRTVQRGLEERQFEGLQYLGMDEYSIDSVT